MIYIDVDTSVTVPVNVAPLVDDSDFKSRETGVAYNASGMDLVWNFITTAGVITQTAVTPTTAGDYDWSEIGDAMYKIEIPASGGASINNDTEGYGWFSGVITGILPFRGPTVGFRAAGINNALVDGAYSTTRGLAGTALPAAAADAAGGLPISDAGALDLDAQLANTHEITAARMGALTDWLNGGRLDLLLDAVLEDTGTTLPALINALENLSSAEAQAAATAALNAYDPPTNAEMEARTKLAAEYATLAKQNTIEGYIDTEIATLLSDLAAVLVDTGTTLDTKLNAVKAVTDLLPDDGALSSLGTLANQTAIKAKTDNLPAAPAATGDAMALADGAITAAKLATDAITAAKIAADAFGSSEISSAAANKIADHILRRTFASAAASSDGDTKSFRSLLGAVAKLVNKIAASGGTLTVYEADDSTSLGTQTLTSDANADPITGADTA